MQTMMRTAPMIVGSSVSFLDTSRLHCDASRRYSSAGSSFAVTLRPGSRSILRLRTDRRRTFSYRGGISERPSQGFSAVRAEQPSGLDEKVKDIALEITSDEAVEGTGVVDREVNLKADELIPADHTGILPADDHNAAAEEIKHKIEEEEDETNAKMAGTDGVLDARPASALEERGRFFRDVEEDAREVAAKLNRSVEDASVRLHEKVPEVFDESSTTEMESPKRDTSAGEEREGGELTQAPTNSEEGELTRQRAQEKIVETAAEGYEVLKWAAEGFISAGKNARQGLEIARELMDKRLKSFQQAADETREVSSQVAEDTQKRFEEMQGSASKFGEELQVNIEEKKAEDSLKPESERNPLGKLGQELQENFTKATAEDGPLGTLNRTLSENFTKVSNAGQELASKGSEASRDFASKASGRVEEVTEKLNGEAEELSSSARSSVESSKGALDGLDLVDAAEELKKTYEDEQGNDMLKDVVPVSSIQENASNSVDEGQAIPSEKRRYSHRSRRVNSVITMVKTICV